MFGDEAEGVEARPLDGALVPPVGGVQHLDEQRQPAVLDVEGAVGAQIEPQVVGQAHLVALDRSSTTKPAIWR